MRLQQMFAGLSPMDQYGWMDAPIVTQVPLNNGPPSTQLAKINAQRICLIISNSSAGTTAFIQPTKAPTGITQGIPLPNTLPFVVFNYDDHDALVQADWYAIAGVANVSVSVIELTIHRWPTSEEFDVFQQIAPRRNSRSQLAQIIARLKREGGLDLLRPSSGEPNLFSRPRERSWEWDNSNPWNATNQDNVQGRRHHGPW